MSGSLKLIGIAIIVAIGIIAAVVLAAFSGQLSSRSATDSPQQSSVASGERLVVLTSISPIANIVKNVGGDRIDIIQVVPDGVDSHTFKLSVTDEVILKTRANIVILNGLNLEETIEDAVMQSQNPNLRLLKLADRTIDREDWVFDNSFPQEGGNPNPHLWLSVEYAMKYAELVRDELSLADPTNAEHYDSNTDRYLVLLRKLEKAITQSVQTILPENRKLITYHDSWPYFAKRYGFEVVAALQPAHFGEPTENEILQIVAKIRAEHVPAIFASEVFPNNVTLQIADEADVQVVRTLRDDALPGDIDASQHTYVGMMVANIRTIVDALGGNLRLLDDIDPSNTYQRLP